MAQEETTSNIRQEYNLGRIGLNLDSSVNQVDKGKLTYALNAALENFDDSSVNYQNEPGNVFCLNFPTNYHLIGEHFIAEKNKHIFFLTNPETGDSEIGYMDNNDCNYHTLCTEYPDLGITVCASSPCLNFNINSPIHKIVHKITNCTTEIYWTDGINPRRYLDINSIPYISTIGDTNCDIIATAELDCNKIKVQPNFNIPMLTIDNVINGGDLKAGTYQFAIQYCDASGNSYTSFYSVTNPTPIANTKLTTPNFDYAVGRSIVINIGDLDITGYFQYYNIAVIKTINDISSVELVGTYFIENSYRQITYTGQNKTSIALSINDIFEKYPYYEIAQDVTSVRDILVWDNLTSIDRINYQKIANQITLKWESWRIPATEDYSDELNATNLRGYLRDEIYAFEIVFLLRNGKQTDGFHIPGRIKNSNEAYADVINTDPDFVGTPTSGEYSPYWKIYNTGSVTGYDPAYSAAIDKITYKGPYQYGEFAYWQSAATYPCQPDIWGDLAGEYIRHHKFPDVSISPVFESATPIILSGGKYGVAMQSGDAVFPIGVKLDVVQILELVNSSDLTTDQKADIVAFKIVRGNRSTNKSIVAKGILRNVGKYKREDTEFYYPNYPYNDLNTDPFLLVDNNAYNEQCTTYQTNVITSGLLQYTDCNTGNTNTMNVFVGTAYSICSLTEPVMVEGVATFTVISYYTYQLACKEIASNTTFQYTNPVTFAITNLQVFYYEPVIVNSTVIPTRTDGSNYYTITTLSTRNSYCYPSKLDGFATTPTYDPRYRMVFNSPETSFGQPVLGSILKLENVMFGAGVAHFVNVKNHSLYKLITEQAQLAALDSSYAIASIGGFDATAMFTAYQAYLQIYINGITRKNYTYSFNSVANYDYCSVIPNGQGVKQRELDIIQYIIPGVQSTGDDHNINNYNRESSVYLKTVNTRAGYPIIPLPFPNKTPSLVLPSGESAISDTSRFTASEKSTCNNPEKQVATSVVSYYGSIKNDIVNQWGQMYSYQTIDTGFQYTLDPLVLVGLNDLPKAVFGGDTFISRFAFKTKLPFFIDNRVNAPDDSDIFYDELGNVAYPQYWYSARSILSNYTPPGKPVMQNIISIKAHNFDCPIGENSLVVTTTTTTSSSTTSATGNVTPSATQTIYDGKMYLFAYGIPNFYCESSINVDLRQAFNNLEGDFYPHVSTGIPDNWLQQTIVPIAFDNTYTYNVTYSRQNTENTFSHLPPDWTAQLCYTHYPFRATYSDTQESDPNIRVNNWLIYRPISFFDFPQNYGSLISLDGIQNKAVLARFENKSLLYNTLLTINTSNPQAAYLGNDSLFRSSPPIDFAETDLGYVGTQNKMLLKIPQGQITVDAKRGQVFLIAGNQAQDLSAFGSGLNKFFTDHLAFEILRYFPTADIDNHFNGLGLHGVYDSKYDRIIISKLDYIPQLSQQENIIYDGVLEKFYVNKTFGTTVIRQYIDLTNPEYFCNKSWTLSFNMNTKSWVSFHSYIPNFYIAENNFFYSGLNEGCDLAAIAAHEIPTPPTTTTTTTPYPDCSLAGTAVYPCNLEGTASCVSGCEGPTTTTTTTTISGPTTTTTTTAVGPTTTTTTTTRRLVWYTLYKCADGSSTTSTSYFENTFVYNNRVFNGGVFYTIVNQVYTDPGGVQLNISNTGQTGCP